MPARTGDRGTEIEIATTRELKCMLLNFWLILSLCVMCGG
jgi:hypothetical protein